MTSTEKVVQAIEELVEALVRERLSVTKSPKTQRKMGMGTEAARRVLHASLLEWRRP